MPSRHPYKRAERVADLLRQVLSELLLTRVHHLGVDGLTVTAVKISDDLQHARIYYRVLKPENRAEVAKQLPKVATLLRKEIGQHIKMRYTPELKFEYDESLEYGHRIEALLNSIHSGEGEK